MKTILSGEEISREMNISRIADKSQQRTNVWLRGQREEGCSSTGYFSKMKFYLFVYNIYLFIYI